MINLVSAFKYFHVACIHYRAKDIYWGRVLIASPTDKFLPTSQSQKYRTALLQTLDYSFHGVETKISPFSHSESNNSIQGCYGCCFEKFNAKVLSCLKLSAVLRCKYSKSKTARQVLINNLVQDFQRQFYDQWWIQRFCSVRAVVNRQQPQ